jgi:hypothetical protein
VKCHQRLWRLIGLKGLRGALGGGSVSAVCVSAGGEKSVLQRFVSDMRVYE